MAFVVGFLVSQSALGPIGGLSARQCNSCLPRREDKEEDEDELIRILCWAVTNLICCRVRHGDMSKYQLF